MTAGEWEPMGYEVAVTWRWAGNRKSAIATYRGYDLAIWRDHYDPAARDPGGLWGRGVWYRGREVHVDFHAMFTSHRAQCSAVAIAHLDLTGRLIEWPAIRNVSVFPATPAA